MAKRKKEMEREIVIGDYVKITLGGCSINGKTGEVVNIEKYGFKNIYNVSIDGKEHRVNARFCQFVEKSEPEEKGEPEEVEKPEEVKEPIKDNGENDNEH